MYKIEIYKGTTAIPPTEDERNVLLFSEGEEKNLETALVQAGINLDDCMGEYIEENWNDPKIQAIIFEGKTIVRVITLDIDGTVEIREG
jgi:hypothetical protein